MNQPISSFTRRDWDRGVGVRSLPGFDESLRLLVEREQYSLRDIAMMFGISRERVRQLCGKLTLHLPDVYEVGRRSARVWDDAANRFRPVSRGRAIEQRSREQRDSARARRDHLRSERRERIVAAVVALRSQLDREPTWREMHCVVIGTEPEHPNRAQLRVLNAWETRHMSTREKHRTFRDATGTKSRRPRLNEDAG